MCCKSLSEMKAIIVRLFLALIAVSVVACGVQVPQINVHLLPYQYGGTVIKLDVQETQLTITEISINNGACEYLFNDEAAEKSIANLHRGDIVELTIPDCDVVQIDSVSLKTNRGDKEINFRLQVMNQEE